MLTWRLSTTSTAGAPSPRSLRKSSLPSLTAARACVTVLDIFSEMWTETTSLRSTT